jgi:hypothetical protein
MNLAKDVWSSPFVLRASKEVLGWVNQSMWNAKYSSKKAKNKKTVFMFIGNTLNGVSARREKQ